MTRSRFVDGLLLLDARETRSRLAEALAAARAHPAYVEHPESRLASAVGLVEVELLFAARDAVKKIDGAMQAAAKATPTAAPRPSRAAAEDFVEEEPEEVEPSFDCRGCGERLDPYEATPTPGRPDLPPLCINCSRRG